MIGSDWPVCLVAGSYGSVMNLVVDFIRRLSSDEQARVLGGTCCEVYRLLDASGRSRGNAWART